MRCNEFQERWQRLLDDRRSPESDELLIAHALQCEDCDGLLRTQIILFAELSNSSTRRNRHLQPKVASARTQQQPVRSRWMSWTIVAGIAASLLVLLVPSIIQKANRTGNGPRIAMGGKPGIGHAALTVSGPSPRRDRSNISELSTDRQADQEAFRKLMHDVAAKLSDVPEERLEPLDRIAGGFKPLASTLGVAWDALRRTIPVKRSPSLQEPQAVIGCASDEAQV